MDMAVVTNRLKPKGAGVPVGIPAPLLQKKQGVNHMYPFYKILKIGFGISMFIGLAAGAAFAGWGGEYGMYPGGHMMGTGYMGWTMIFFWVALLLILVLIIRWVLGLSRSNEAAQQTAVDILKKRLASGDIDIEEFNKRKQLLG
jgi:putative membrane protein